MIIVIEQNIVFSIEVYECRHLRLYSQSTMCRLSQEPPVNNSDVMQGSTFVHWVENVPHDTNASIPEHHQLSHFSITSFQLISFHNGELAGLCLFWFNDSNIIIFSVYQVLTGSFWLKSWLGK